MAHADEAFESTLGTRQEDETQETQLPRLSVVGLGASAGGLTPLRTFLRALPADTGMTFVVITHLSPEHESALPDLLQPHTAMPVQQVTARVEMQPNHVYVIPPGKRLLVMEDYLDLADFERPRGQRLQIDAFFRSLAEYHGDGGAVILSGSGSDGAVGIQSIKEKGGLILVQDPQEAEYDGMPKSAIATGLVDIVAPAAALATQLVAAKRTGALLELPTDPNDLSQAAEETLLQILTHLRVRTDHDFTGYKRSTILRRIRRRMQVTQLSSLTAYLHRLRHDSEEVDVLYRDLLIHVTEFFRDPQAWETLAQTVIPTLFAGKGRDEPVRVWTVGCATGEEAYGIAMLLLEHAATLRQPPQIQVFASDLGEVALAFARHGVYPAAIAANVAPERLERFFTEENSQYRVRDDLRERVLFTEHNLLQDPPFSKLDLVLCRNLLIYLQRPLQEQVFEAFHYALRPEGYLFLGSAESADNITSLFEAVDKEHRIYRRSQRSPGTVVLPTLPLHGKNIYPMLQGEAQARGTASNHEPVQPWLMEAVAPPSLLVDETYHVRRLSETAGRYLQHPAGVPTTEVLKLVRPELQADLRAALFRALGEEKTTLTRPVPVRFNGASFPVALLVRPVRVGTAQAQVLIFFLEDETPLTTENGSSADVAQTASTQQLQAELAQAQRQFQALREEYETTVEELRSANEELQSTNEEYRSTLEELETSQEELQSINEELQTVNLELRHKVEETSQAHSDLHNLFAATEIATLFLDRELKIKRYTPRAAELFNLMLADQGRPISHLRTNLHYEQLEADAHQVLAKLIPIEREVVSAQDTWFHVNVRPYRTANDHIDGVVITFVDITSNKKNELALRESEERYRMLVESAQEYAIFMLDAAGRITTWNTGAERVFGYPEAEAIGMDGAAIFTDDDRAAGVPEAELETARRTGQASHERWQRRKDGTLFWAGGVTEALRHADGGLRGFVKVLRDNSEQKQTEETLRRFNETLEAQVAERTQQVRDLVIQLSMSEQEERQRISQVLHDDLQQRLYSIQYQLSFLQELLDPADEAALGWIAEVEEDLQASIGVTRSLSVDLSPPVLEGEGLDAAIGWLAGQMERQHGLVITVQAIAHLPVPATDLRVLLFQVVRETLFNIVKHTDVREATVTLRELDHHLQVEVIDRGPGFDVDAMLQEPGRSHGLLRNQQRLELVGGRMQIRSTPGEGTHVMLTCPLSRKAIDNENSEKRENSEHSTA